MFILYAVVAGLVLGLLAGGQLSRLGEIRLRWAPLILVGFLVQVVLFSDVVAERVGALGPVLYVGSTRKVGAAKHRNHHLPGFPLVVLGAACNMAAIVANGGFMPAAPGAVASLGERTQTIYSNSAVVAQPALEFLTDRFAMPRMMPFANIFSIGDVILGIGVAVVIVSAMRRRPGPASPQPVSA